MIKKPLASEQLIISLSDLWTGLKRGKKKILVTALLVGLAFSWLQLRKPICYTATGIFKTAEKKSQNLLFAQLLGAQSDIFAGEENPKTLFLSTPVLTQVAKKLHLQGTLSEPAKNGRFNRLWETLRAEGLRYAYIKHIRPSSAVLAGDIPVPDYLPFADPQKTLLCKEITYDREIFTNLSIHFQDEDHFTVTDTHHTPIGSGQLNTPFESEIGCFTLEKQGAHKLSGRSYPLSLVPLNQVALSLQKNLQVAPEKKNPSLYNVSYTHRDRHFATSLVNLVMEEYDNYLSTRGEHLISKQLQYLAKRQQQTTDELEKILIEYREILKKTIGEGGFISLDVELEFIANAQAQFQAQLARYTSMIQGLVGEEYDGDLPKLLQKISQQKIEPNEVFTIEAAEGRLAAYQNEIDTIDYEKSYLNYCLEKLSEPTFDVATLSKSSHNATLLNLFEQIHALQLKLIDEKNWSPSERDHLKEEIALQKKFLVQHFENLVDGADLQKSVLHQKIHSLKQTTLALIYDEHTIIESRLKDLAERATHYPDKKLCEQKMTLNTEMQTDIFRTITKMIESKNIAFHLEHTSSYPLAMAIPPIFPNNPKIRLFAFIGALLGAIGTIAFLVLQQIARGPTGSRSNLRAFGYPVADRPAHDREAIRQAAHFLADHRIGLISSQTSSTLASRLATLLDKRARRVCILSLGKSAPQGLVDYLLEKTDELNWQTNHLPWGKPTEYKAELLGSPRFQKLLTTLQESYDTILIDSVAHPHSVETQELTSIADSTIYRVTDEKLSTLEELPEKTFFLVQPSAPEKEFTATRAFLQKRGANLKLHLRQLEPLLDALKEKIASTLPARKP